MEFFDQPTIHLRPMPMRSLTFTAVTLLLVMTGAQSAEKLYRWVDEQGNVHFTDSIPPTQVTRPYSQLNTKGLEVRNVEAAKTPEEIAREKEIEVLRKEQQRLIEEQKTADNRLLEIYRNEEDVKSTRDGKIAAVDVQMQVTASNNRRLKAKLSDLQKKAAEYERQGKKTPDNLEKDIEETRRSLREGYSLILRSEEQKNEVRAKYDGDLERFRFLKKLRATAPVQGEVKKRMVTDLPRVYPCVDAAACSRGWENAVAFVKEFSTTPIQMVTEQLILTYPPATDKDTSLTISRIASKDGSHVLLFLDLQCKESAMGVEHCRSESVRQIENRFRGYLETTQPKRAETNPATSSVPAK